MHRIDFDFELLKSIVADLDRNLFIKNEAENIQAANSLLNSEDIELYFTKDFIKELKARLQIKIEGFIKQAELDREMLVK